MRLLCLCFALLAAACSPESPYAPGVRGMGGDQMVVGNRLMEAGEYQTALRAYTRAASKRGMTAEVLGAIGTANLALGRLGQAEQFLRRAIEAPDATPEMWNNLGVALLEQGETSEAVQVFRRAFALSSGDSPQIRDNLAKALAKRDDPDYDISDNGPKLIYRGTGNVLLVTE